MSQAPWTETDAWWMCIPIKYWDSQHSHLKCSNFSEAEQVVKMYGIHQVLACSYVYRCQYVGRINSQLASPPERFFLQNLPLPIAKVLSALLKALQLEREKSTEIKPSCQKGKVASGEPRPTPSAAGRNAANPSDCIARRSVCSLTRQLQGTKHQPYACPALLLPLFKVPFNYNEHQCTLRGGPRGCPNADTRSYFVNSWHQQLVVKSPEPQTRASAVQSSVFHSTGRSLEENWVQDFQKPTS